MGRIVTPVKIQNLQNPEYGFIVDVLVDTAAAYLTLPLAWKERLGELRSFGIVTTQFANQMQGTAEVFGPVILSMKGFRDISTEVLFLDMQPDDTGSFEALLGYIPLEQASAAVDMLGHRLVQVKCVDLKRV